MPSRDIEVSDGIRAFELALQKASLKLVKTHRYQDRLATYFAISSGKSTEVDVVLTHEFLSDFPRTQEQQNALAEYVRDIKHRLDNPSPQFHYCLSEVPVRIDIEWPVQWVPNRAASFVWVRLQDLRTGLISACSAIMTHQFEIMDVNLKLNPFLREQFIVTNVREAIDRDELPFFVQDQMPTELPSVRIQKFPEIPPPSRPDIRRFLMGKVYWLGFKQGDRKTKVWLADPWDAAYLGTNTQNLLQIGQTLEAGEFVMLDNDGFANAGKNLLLESESFEFRSLNSKIREFNSGAD
jgi:hypothetical protein